MNKTLRFSTWVLGLLFCLNANLLAQQKLTDHTILLKSQRITPLANAQSWFDSIAINHKARTPLQVLLQFDELPSQTQRNVLKASGITLYDYIPNYAYLALVASPFIYTNSFGIRSVLEFKIEWKIDGRIKKELNSKSDRRMKVLVSFINPETVESVEQHLSGLEASITDRRFDVVGTYEIELPRNKINSLANEAAVKYIGLPADITPLNYDAAASSGALLLNSGAGGGLDGSGVTIGVGDVSSAIVHVDVRDRLKNFNPFGISMHGVHTTLTVAGKGIMDPRTIGMAPAAKVLTHLYDIVWANTQAMYNDYNMTITNNSYAALVELDSSGVYDQYSILLDDYGLKFPKVQNVFASGNSGLSTFHSYPAAFHTVNGGYQVSKNILTVGALAKDNIVWPKSSRGPVMDGRLKPEVVAYGFGIFSGDIFDNYGNSNGTSMSCPVATGCMGLLEQRYKQLHGNNNAPSNLLKALVMNGATDFGNPGPDYTHGYGLVNAYRSKVILDSNRYLIDSIDNGANKIHSVTVPPNTAQVKIMLYWHDAPANPQAMTALVNNLDMKVTEPGGTNMHKPLILDTIAANVANNAIEGVDDLNNSEQVVINNPPAGTYTINIDGKLVPSGRQEYVLVYDFIPVGVKIKQPVTGDAVPGNDSIRIYWDASNDVNSFKVEYSTNAGGSWNSISNNVAADQRQLVWYTPNFSTIQARVRVSRNSTTQQDQTANFTINAQPVVTLSPVQCPGYIAIDWTSVSGVSEYEVLKKIGDDLRPVDTVALPSALHYVFSGLAKDTMYYVGIRPLVNGKPGFRSKSVKRMPNDGTCAGSISDGDLLAEAIIGPGSGRKFTSTELKANETLSISISNLDDQAANNYRVSYSLNGGAWQNQTLTTSIPPLGSQTVNFPGLNLNTVGTYQIRVAVQNLAINDPVKKNDTLGKTIRQVDNNPVDLNNGFTDGFESSAIVSVTKDSMGVLPNDHWDYVNSNDTGRLSSFVSSDVLISGQRSISLDQLFNTTDWLNMPANQNYFMGTFNLQAYDTASTEARVEFDYKIHGQPKHLLGNEVWVRGKDTDPWVNIFTIDTSAIPGEKINTGSLSVTKSFTNNGQMFSSSMQVRIGQHDTSVIALNEYGNGLTIDNFKLYSVKNDVQLLSIVSPDKMGCGMIGSVPLQLLVYNSDNLLQDSIYFNYRLDNGPVVRDTLPFINAKDTVYFTFKNQLSNLNTGYHRLDVWLENAGDSYLANDSIINFQFRNQPIVETFPYLETFEATDGDWYTEGVKTSWQYGQPNSVRVKKAASGTKVWATGLTGNYNDNEQSYLYSPCFDISLLDKPMLSFSLSTDIENCGATPCDGAYIEYSEDGKVWTKLGNTGEGTNWYGTAGVWNDTNKVRWRVASIPLPHGFSSLKLRFVFVSDQGSGRDGISVDDIHIFDLKYPIYDGVTTTVSGNVKDSTTFTTGSRVLAWIKGSQPKGTTEVKMYNHSYVFNPVVKAYHLARNYVIHPGQKTTDTATVRLFITDEEVVKLLEDNSCDTCSKSEDAYRLGITKYDDDNKSTENGSLSDNVAGTYSFIPYTSIGWVPYDKGYYAQIRVSSFSEFWFNTGIPAVKFAGPVIFPNPITEGKINIIWNAEPGTEMQLMMVDAVGRVVYRSSIAAVDFDNRTTVQLPEVETGMYILRYILGEQTEDIKMIVTRR